MSEKSMEQIIRIAGYALYNDLDKNGDGVLDMKEGEYMIAMSLVDLGAASSPEAAMADPQFKDEIKMLAQ